MRVKARAHSEAAASRCDLDSDLASRALASLQPPAPHGMAVPTAPYPLTILPYHRYSYMYSVSTASALTSPDPLTLLAWVPVSFALSSAGAACARQLP